MPNTRLFLHDLNMVGRLGQTQDLSPDSVSHSVFLGDPLGRMHCYVERYKSNEFIEIYRV